MNTITKKRVIPKAALRRLLHDIQKLEDELNAYSGATRMANDVVEPLVEAIEEYIKARYAEAIKLARQAGRKTVRGQDLQFLAEMRKSF